MCGPVVELIGTHIAEATRLYHRLIMVVGPVGSGKTKALRAAAQKAQTTPVNLNLELSRNMLDLTERQRTLEMPRIVKEIHRSPNRARHAMNMALVSIGLYRPGLEKKAIAAARSIGKVEVDHGETSCKTPDAVAYIRKVKAHEEKKAASKQAKKKRS